MKKFSINLNHKQELFLTSLLPKGYSFAQTKQNARNTHLTQQHQNLKELTLTSKQKDSSSKGSSSQQQTSQNKVKDSHQLSESKKSLLKQKVIMKSQKKQSSQLLSKKSQKIQLFEILLDQIQKKKSALIFIQPVDPIKLKIPNYFDVIKHPMAIETMRNKVKQGKYLNFSQFEEDLQKIASNCIKFNAGNNFFVQTAKKFSTQFKKVIQKYQQKIDKIFKEMTQAHQKSKSIEYNSEEQTDSEGQANKITRKEKKSQKINKGKQKNQTKQEEHSQKTNQQKKPQEQNNYGPTETKKSNEEGQQKVKQLYCRKTQKPKLFQKQSEKKIESEVETDQKRIEKKDKEQKEKILQKVKDKKTIRIKKYSYEDRLAFISRIKKLDRGTMSQFFKEINFSKGESLDFKVLEDQKIKEMETQLRKYEAIHQEKVRKIEEMNKARSTSEDFEIEEDKDYDD